MGNDQEFTKKLSINIPFSSAETAMLVCDVLSIDKELKGNQLKKDIHVEGNKLCVDFHGSDLKLLRVAVNGFLKNIVLVVKTIKQLQHC